MMKLSREWFMPHRIILALIFLGIIVWMAVSLRWDWLPEYLPYVPVAIRNTLILLIVSCVVGMAMAIPLGLAQAIGPWYLSAPAKAFCTVIRGTPLLIQLYLIYFGLGSSLFPSIPWIRETWIWPLLSSAWTYAILALSISYAGYEGEVMRGAFKSVPRGQLEAAEAFGMPKFTIFRRIWLPQAIQNVLPTLGGETILQLKSTPLVALITIPEIYALASRVRQENYITYEPLLLLAIAYIIIAGVISLGFRWLENKVPVKGH